MAKTSKRKPKHGCVYLLRSLCIDGVYKFGATSGDPRKRAKRVTARYKITTGINYKFEVVLFMDVKDIFYVEKIIKWDLMPFGIGFLSEVIDIDLFDGDERDLKNSFIQIANNANQ